MSRVIVVDHPLVRHKLTLIRDRNTEYFLFKELVEEITYLLLYEASRGLSTSDVQISTPLADMRSPLLEGSIVLVPVLRAGLGMLGGCQKLIPTAGVGFVGVYRDESTLEPVKYYFKSPPLEGARILVLDPMLATGGSLSSAVQTIKAAGGELINIICILASPEGISKVQADHPDVDIFCASIDDGLDSNGYILPGLGDCGDRLYGTK